MSKTSTAPASSANTELKLKDKVAIVTGASSGIGEATAAALARAGAQAVLIARREDRMTALAESIEKEGLKRPLHFVTDVSDQKQVAKAFKETVDKLGRIDVLINNAGVMYVGPVEGANPDDWKKMIDINVLGLMYCTHAVLPTMLKQGAGDVVSISSVSGRLVSARSAVYSATKFAVNAFAEGLRQEVQTKGIRITLIEPGAVATELTDHIADDKTKFTVKEWVAKMTPLTAEDIANSIVYAVTQPRSVSVNEILIRPTDQAF